MVLHLPTGHLKPALGWSRYRNMKPVPTSPLVDNIATVIRAGSLNDDFPLQRYLQEIYKINI